MIKALAWGSLDSGLNQGRVRYLALFAIIAVKLAIVLLIVPSISFLNDGNYNIGTIPDNYPEIAKNVLSGNGYRVRPETAETMIRPPMQVLVLAAIFSIAGESLVAVQIFNVMLTVFGGMLLMGLIRRQTSSSAIAWTALAIFAFHPGTILAETRGGVEVSITFLMIVFVYLLDVAFESRRARSFLFAGLALGLIALTKSTPVIVAPFLLIYAFFRYRDSALSMSRNVLILWFGVGVLIAPWSIRNYLISDQFVPSMTIKGAAAYQGLFLSRGGQGDSEFFEALNEAAEEQKAIARGMGLAFWNGDMLPIFYSASDEAAFDKVLFQQVVDEYKRAPALFAKNVLQNTWRFWLQGRTNSATVLNSIIAIPLLMLCAAGIWISIRKGMDFWLVIIFSATYCAAHLPLIAFAKYSVPIVPFLALFASISIVHAFNVHRDRLPRDLQR